MSVIYYHVTSVLNRASVRQFGLDWRRMGAARGIAGGQRPEQEGCFLALNEFERDWFVRLNNTGGPVDVWEVHGVENADLLLSPEGYHFLACAIPAEKVRLAQRDLPPPTRPGM